MGGIIFALTMPKYSLVGKWTIFNPDGTSIGEFVDLKADNTYTLTLPDRTIGEKGNYQQEEWIWLAIIPD